jgi:hypothetical protein
MKEDFVFYKVHGLRMNNKTVFHFEFSRPEFRRVWQHRAHTVRRTLVSLSLCLSVSPPPLLPPPPPPLSLSLVLAWVLSPSPAHAASVSPRCSGSWLLGEGFEPSPRCREPSDRGASTLRSSLGGSACVRARGALICARLLVCGRLLSSCMRPATLDLGAPRTAKER